MNVALYLVAVPDLSGGGGAERQFANFHQYYNSKENNSKNKLFLITDQDSLVNLKKAGLITNMKNVIVLKTYQVTKPNFSHFIYTLLIHRIHLIHVVNTYTYHNFNLIYKFKIVQKYLRIKLSVNNEVSELIEDVKEYNKSSVLQTRYMSSIKVILEKIKPSGFYTWYKPVVVELKKSNLIDADKCVVKSSEYCFTDLRRFTPSKEKKNYVAYASRLCPEKNPLFYIEAVNHLVKNYESDIKNYKFLLYGKGELEKEIADLIEKYHLQNYIVRGFTTEMNSVFGTSKVFVSTQTFENFTSLAMLEAMACGNVIVAKNVGQTNLFVHENRNGFFYENDDVEGLALAMRKAIQLNDDEFDKMSKHSIYIATELHNVKNFSNEIESFFEEVLAK